MSEPKLVPLVAPLGPRYNSLTVDAKIVNGFVEVGQTPGDMHVYKRPGFLTVTGGTAAAGRGIFYWGGQTYTVDGSSLRRHNIPLVGPPSATLLGSVDDFGMYHFSSCLGATPKLFLTNGRRAYTVDGAGTLAEVTSAITAQSGFPSTAIWVPGAVTLDGYVTILDYAANIWTSTLNIPGTWPGNFGIAQVDSDFPVALVKHLSYILCIKEFYTEVFYDAAQTPWPYGRVDGAKMNFGAIDVRTVCDLGGDLMWVARTREGGAQALVVSNLRPTPVSTPPVERLLAGADYSAGVYSWAARVEGHRLYVLTIVASNFTLVYDMTSRMWYQWTDGSGNYLPYSAASISSTNRILLQHESNGRLYTLDTGTFVDALGTIPVDIYTPNFDGGTRKFKTLSKLSIFGDQYQGAEVFLQFSDDDYQTWHDAGPVDLSTEDPFWSDLGSFKKRAFRLHHNSNTPMRVRALEAYLGAGSS